MHPDTNKSFLLFSIHTYKKTENIYINKFTGYNDNDYEEFINNENKIKDIINLSKIQLNENEFYLILKILFNKLMISGDKIWTNFYYSNNNCPFCDK